MATTTMVSAMPSLALRSTGLGMPSRYGLMFSIAVTPPTAPASALINVMPIWMVARNRSGSACRRWTSLARGFPASTSWRIRLLRTVRMAISAAAKNPFARINTKMAKIGYQGKSILGGTPWGHHLITITNSAKNSQGGPLTPGKAAGNPLTEQTVHTYSRNLLRAAKYLDFQAI